ncbi:hypothetical protein KEM60_01003 [Austwickia sp. TVS 96-490-7B]|uniref:YczE/YyaS/YitT family protein n=1 Tax=Austwickia sp. TVS 96-490-7B TaxID=2830843 RepID=UPI001C55A76D|nr:hypothetical protein [Austwickia sp. TVS 96-490-7B]MBW3084814.1 hypothetical protein [Austwickia sp. TVS 96-490-7B]
MIVRRYPPARLLLLVVSCLVLALGVALLLGSRQGADGYSTMLNGLRLFTGWSFTVVSVSVALLFVGIAWAKGVRPDVGTLTQPVVVGIAVELLLPVVPWPEATLGRWVEFVVGFTVICVGIAGYLAADLGIGPTEGPAIAFDDVLPFQWGYMALQVGGCLLGWSCGADVGLGTLVVVFGIGPVVDRMRPLMPRWGSE